MLSRRFFKINLIKSNCYSTQCTINLSCDIFDKYKSSKALVIAHGLFASKDSWRSVARMINEITKYKVYTVDLRNHAASMPYVEEMNYISMANDLKNFIEKIVLNDQEKQVTCIGHSMGGKTMMTFALENPNLVSKLVVLDVSPNKSPSASAITSYLQLMKNINFLNCKNIQHAREVADAELVKMDTLARDKPMRMFLLTRITQKNGKFTWNFNVDGICNSIGNIMDFPSFNQKFSKPTLFLGGEKSNYILDKDLVDIYRYFSNFQLRYVKNAGHVVHLDNPKETIDFIDKFLNDQSF